MVRRTQVRTGLRFLADARRAAAVKGAVQEQFGDAIRGLSDAEQDSKELKSAKRQALIERILADVQLPFPAGPGGVMDAATAAAVKSAVDSIYKQIVRTKIAVEKRRPDGRSETEIRQVTAQVGLTPRTHGSALFTRGQTQALTLSRWARSGGAAPRRPVAGHDEALHAPLQLPALLGRARPASCAAPSAATSATAPWPSARWCR